MDKKICKGCGTDKPLSDYQHAYRLPGGYKALCRNCVSKRAKEIRDINRLDPVWREKRNKKARNDRRGKYNPAPPEQRRLIDKNRKKIYPEKYGAAKALYSVPMPGSGFHRHHWSYNKEHWTDIIVLSYPDHVRLHHFLVYDKLTFFYRTLNGELIDTKEKHLSYFESIKGIDY